MADKKQEILSRTLMKECGCYPLRNVKVYCPVTKRMITVHGSITPLVNGLEELIVKHCDEKHCSKRSRQHEACLVGKNLQAGKW